MTHPSSWLSATPLVCLTLWLCACSSKHEQAEPPAQSSVYKQELDKARSVNDTVLQQKDSMDQALQQQENPGAE